MGGAFTGLADSPEAVGYNVAGTAQLRHVTYSLSVATPLFTESAYQAALTYSLGSRWTLFGQGRGIYGHGITHVQTGRSCLGVSTRLFDVRSLRVSEGVGLDLYDSEYKNFNVNGAGVGMDLGLLARLDLPSGFGKAIQAGFSMVDQGATLKWSTGYKGKLPALKSLGLAYRATDHLTAAWTFDHQYDPNLLDPYRENMRYGAEYAGWKGHLSLRAGFVHNEHFHAWDRGSGGIGIKSGPYELQYAYVNFPRNPVTGGLHVHPAPVHPRRHLLTVRPAKQRAGRLSARPFVFLGNLGPFYPSANSQPVLGLAGQTAIRHAPTFKFSGLSRPPGRPPPA